MKLKRFLFIGVAFVMMVALVLTGCEDLSQSKGKECTITFNADGGSFSEGETTQTQTVNSGASVGASMPANPERSGYNFGGWWTLQNGGGTEFTGSTTVTESITVYAYWTTAGKECTITFNADGGSFSEGETTQTQTVNSGASVDASMPANPERSGYSFGGWWTLQNGDGTEFTGSTTVTESITVYAYWTTAVPNTSLKAALEWLTANAKEGDEYNLTLTENESIEPQTLSYDGKNVDITITGGEAERKVSLSSTGSLFIIEEGVTLTLDKNVSLQGLNENTALGENTASLVQVKSGGTLVMNTGSKISDNETHDGGKIAESCGGVYVEGGTFTMNGGAISGNRSSSYGGGVWIRENGTFTMSGGEISKNFSYNGGGVYISDGTFTMSNGKINDNSGGSGAGVYIFDGTFTMSDGEISGNSASYNGGGVVVGGSFTMSGGKISGNSVSAYNGGGVFVLSKGGGYIKEGTFIKESGGVIYGSDADDALKNTAAHGDSNGHGVYVPIDESSGKIRNTTADSGVVLDSTKDGSSGGWE